MNFHDSNMLKKYALFFALMLSISTLYGQTIIWQDVTWENDPATGTYIVSGDYDIIATLTIAPGTNIVFNGNSRLNIYGGSPGGRLLAIGSINEPILFNGNNHAGGIKFEECSTDSSILDYCIISYFRNENLGTGLFSALAFEYSDNVRVSNTTISDNIQFNDNPEYFSNTFYGAGVYCSDSSPIFLNSFIRNNKIDVTPWLQYAPFGNEYLFWVGGGGVYSRDGYPTFINSTISNNIIDIDIVLYLPDQIFVMMDEGGSGICGNAQLINCTISNNKSKILATSEDGTISPYSYFRGGGVAGSGGSMTNTIVWGNTTVWFTRASGEENRNTYEEGIKQVGGYGVNYSGIQGGYTGTGNLNLSANNTGDTNSPYFTDPDNGDHSLTVYSACLGAGTNTGAPSKDILGNPRPNPAGSNCDIGAYELGGILCVNGNATFGGIINETILWNCAYINVESDVTITDNGILIIAPGTVVRFKGDYGIYVEGIGKLIAEGAINDTIKFDADYDTDGIYGENFGSAEGEEWKGIRFGDTESTTGMNLSADSSKISYCKITHANANHSGLGSHGGAVYIQDFDKVRISNNQIINNKASGDGGGVACYSIAVGGGCSPLITNNVIDYNNSSWGGGIFLKSTNTGYCSPIIKNNIINENTASTNGGGIGSYRASTGDVSPNIYNNTISNNTSGGKGAGIYNLVSSPFITNNKISGNTSSQDGGGIYCQDNFSNISNNIISNNSAAWKGGGIYCYNSSPKIINNTICKNSDGNNTGGTFLVNNSDALIVNTIFWGNITSNGNQFGFGGGSSITLQYCAIQGGYTGTGNINLSTNNSGDANSPYFTNPDDDNWFLSNSSVCINAGSPNYNSADPVYPSFINDNNNYKINLDASTTVDLPETCIDGCDRNSGTSIEIGAFENPTVLPVELTSFAVSISGNTVLLNWQTAIEVNNYGFEVEKNKTLKVKNQKWEIIGFVAGHGNSNSFKNYSFSDNAPFNGKSHYRLKQVDTDGKFKYSEVVEVEYSTPEKFQLFQNYPNPFNPTTNIKYRLAENGFVTLKLFDVLGQEVKTLINEFQESGSYEIKLDAAGLAGGVYLMQLKCGSFQQVKKMILNK